MPDLKQYSDEEILQAAGVGNSENSTQDFSQYSDEEILKMAGNENKPEPSKLATVARSIMRNIPSEQAQTVGAMMKEYGGITPEAIQESNENIKKFMAGGGVNTFTNKKPVTFETDESRTKDIEVNKKMAEREKDIAREGTIAQFKTPMELALLASAGVNPVQTLKMLGKFGLVSETAKLAGVDAVIDNIENPDLKDAADVVKFSVEGALSGVPWRKTIMEKTPLGKPIDTALNKISEKTLPMRERLATGLNNVFIAKKKQYFNPWNEHPAYTIAKEGVTGKNNLEILSNVQEKELSVRNELIDRAASHTEKYDVNAIFNEVQRKIDSTKIALSQSNPALGEKLQGILDDTVGIKNPNTGQVVGKQDLSNMSITDIIELRRKLNNIPVGASKEGIQWDSKSKNHVDSFLRSIYHKLNDKIYKADPLLGKLNKRDSNLINASQAVGEFVKKETDSFTVKNVDTYNMIRHALRLPGMAFNKMFLNPGIRTKIAAWLVETPKEIKSQMFEKFPGMQEALISSFKGNKLLTSKVKEAQKLLTAPQTKYGEGFEMVEPAESQARVRQSKIIKPQFETNIKGRYKSSLSQETESSIERFLERNR